jgi:phosphotransferase system HPr-like phosphotransfer protein
MKNEFLISLNAIKKIKEFVKIVDKFDSDIDITQGRYVIDAKSIMAIFSLNLLEPMKIKIISVNEKEIESFNNVMEEFKYECEGK